MQEIRCQNPKCNKLLLEATGEVKKRCPKCGTWTHVVVTSVGVIPINSTTATEQYKKLNIANESELLVAEKLQNKFNKDMDKSNSDSFSAQAQRPESKYQADKHEQDMFNEELQRKQYEALLKLIETYPNKAYLPYWG